MEKNDDEQRNKSSLFPLLPNQDLVKFLPFISKKLIIHVEGGFFQHSFWAETLIAKHS